MSEMEGPGGSGSEDAPGAARWHGAPGAAADSRAVGEGGHHLMLPQLGMRLPKYGLLISAAVCTQ